MQWKLRYTKEDGNVTLEAIQLQNNSTRACLSFIDTIIEASVGNDETMSSTLIIAMEKYEEALKLLTLHCELTEDEIEDFQTLINDFFELWIGIFGSQGVTNYIHRLASGHVSYFLKEYKCLYLYSQQGWEALNGEIQTFIHQNSQCGGHNSGTKKGDRSYILVPHKGAFSACCLSLISNISSHCSPKSLSFMVHSAQQTGT